MSAYFSSCWSRFCFCLKHPGKRTFHPFFTLNCADQVSVRNVYIKILFAHLPVIQKSQSSTHAGIEGDCLHANWVLSNLFVSFHKNFQSFALRLSYYFKKYIFMFNTLWRCRGGIGKCKGRMGKLILFIWWNINSIFIYVCITMYI